jgi:FOG: Transposase and inactivated derivatives
VKKQTKPIQRSHKFDTLRQICNLIPTFLVSQLARQTGVDKKARTFTPWSHVVTMLYAQLTHALSLNDVCDALKLFSGPLSAIRGAVGPSPNALSHANQVRDARMAEQLLWEQLDHLRSVSPRFGAGDRRLHRFKRRLYAVDSTVITLVANCMSWAKHRRRKAATKLHMRLDLQSLLPRFAIVDLAPHHDNSRAAQMCADLRAGEIAIFDKAFLAFANLWKLTERGVFWVTRTKENLDYRVVKRSLRKAQGKILRDDLIELRGPKSKTLYPQLLRRVLARIELRGEEVEMEFLTNNLEWSGQSIADLYGCRWDIEKFFRQIKQTFQLADFLGNSANAVHWQIWIALLVYVLLRYLAFLSQWQQSFTRLWALCRSSLWRKIDLVELLKSCGTAGQRLHFMVRAEQAYFAGF